VSTADVIIPTFNDGDLLGRAIDSALARSSRTSASRTASSISMNAGIGSRLGPDMASASESSASRVRASSMTDSLSLRPGPAFAGRWPVPPRRSAPRF